MQTLGQRLRKERLRLGLSTQKFAEIGGVGAGSQSRYEHDVTKPSSDYFHKIKQAEPEFEMLWVMFGEHKDDALRDKTAPQIPADVRQLVSDYKLCSELTQNAIRQMAKAGADAKRELVKQYKGKQNA